MRRETPPARALFGISTRKRPARLMKVVRAAPLLPRSSFLDLDDDFLAFVQQLADVAAAGRLAALEIFLGDFLQRQEAVTFRAVIDEARFETRLDARDAALVDVSFLLFA
jgi:hypothetical protein